METKITSVILISVISMMLITSITLTNVNEVDAKKSKSNKATLKVTFMDIGKFHGKVNVKLVNEVTGKTLFKDTTSLKQDNKETYKYKPGNTKVGDRMNFVVNYKFPAGGVGGWGEGFDFKKSVSIHASLDEIDCGGIRECD